MTHDLDRMLERLSNQPVPARLGRLEVDLARQIGRPRVVAATPAWRSVAVSLALVAGMGIGGSAAAWNGARAQSHIQSDDFLSGARLAPSALLSDPG